MEIALITTYRNTNTQHFSIQASIQASIYRLSAAKKKSQFPGSKYQQSFTVKEERLYKIALRAERGRYWSATGAFRSTLKYIEETGKVKRKGYCHLAQDLL